MIASRNSVALHPPRKQLQEFVAGELPAGLSVALSAHIEICEDCQQASAELQESVSADWADVPVANDGDFAAMLDRIVAQPQATQRQEREAVPREIVINNKSVPLPRVLAKVAAGGLVWKHLRGGVSQAQVALDDQTKCEFIYMHPGSKAPAHTHRGNEVMLVLDGSFSDELGEYKAADFVVRDPSHKHQPQTRDGCLCFSVLDSPLVFTEGFWRLLNPLNRLMFGQSRLFR